MAEDALTRLASILIGKFSDSAEQFACDMADAALIEGDTRRFGQWESVAAAVRELGESGRGTRGLH